MTLMGNFTLWRKESEEKTLHYTRTQQLNYEFVYQSIQFSCMSAIVTFLRHRKIFSGELSKDALFLQLPVLPLRRILVTIH